MRFGLQIETYSARGSANEWDRMLAAAKLVEELGFESVWYEDHFMFPDRDHPEKEVPVMTDLAKSAPYIFSKSLNR